MEGRLLGGLPWEGDYLHAEDVHDRRPASDVPFGPLWLSGEIALRDDLFAVVDNNQLGWASQWRWHIKPSKNGKKFYAVRKARVAGRNVSVFLHKELLTRAIGGPPTPRHIIGDHCNGNSLDCRVSNLRWATPAENRQNYNGWWALQLRLDFKEGGRNHRLSHFQRRGGR